MKRTYRIIAVLFALQIGVLTVSAQEWQTESIHSLDIQTTEQLLAMAPPPRETAGTDNVAMKPAFTVRSSAYSRDEMLDVIQEACDQAFALYQSQLDNAVRREMAVYREEITACRKKQKLLLNICVGESIILIAGTVFSITACHKKK